jgi:hypothetical protein
MDVGVGASVAPEQHVQKRKLGVYGKHLTTLVQFFVTSTNAWVVFSSGDVTNVECHMTELMLGEAQLESISRTWAIPLSRVHGTTRSLLCSSIDAQFMQFCTAVGDSPAPLACDELRLLTGGACSNTIALSVGLLAVLTLVNVACLVAFMWLDAALEFSLDSYDAHLIRCSSWPRFVRARRFSLTMAPTVLMPILAICLMRASYSCVFGDASIMAFALVLIWSVVTLGAVRQYEALRQRYDEQEAKSQNHRIAPAGSQSSSSSSEFDSAFGSV